MEISPLRRLAEEFSSNSAAAAKAIRAIYETDPEGFPAAAADVLTGTGETYGTKYLVALLLAQPDYPQVLCNPEVLSLEQSVALLVHAKKLDPSAEVKLARFLTGLKFTKESETPFAARVLAVLDSSSDSSTALPALRQLLQCPNERVRSKAALLIGRINRNPQWATLEDQGDTRVAANAVESLRGMDTPAARDAFRKAARDSRARVAGNGVIGLYLAGDAESFSFLFRLSEMEVPAYRATAAWSMGRTENPRFLTRLAKLVGDAEGTVRTPAFRSLARIRQYVSALRNAGALHVQIPQAQMSQVGMRDNQHTVRVTVDSDGRWAPGLDQRRFVVWNGPFWWNALSSASMPIRHHRITRSVTRPRRLSRNW